MSGANDLERLGAVAREQRELEATVNDPGASKSRDDIKASWVDRMVSVGGRSHDETQVDATRLVHDVDGVQPPKSDAVEPARSPPLRLVSGEGESDRSTRLAAPRAWRSPAIVLTALAAAAVLIVSLRSSDSQKLARVELPAYELRAQGGDLPTRGEPSQAARHAVGRGARVAIELVPPRPVERPVVVRAFVRDRSRQREVTSSIERDASGAMRLASRAGLLFDGFASGTIEVVIVIADASSSLRDASNVDLDLARSDAQIHRVYFELDNDAP